MARKGVDHPAAGDEVLVVETLDPPLGFDG
jgi:hypothetical protein